MRTNPGIAEFSIVKVGRIRIDSEGATLIAPARPGSPFAEFWQEELSNTYLGKNTEHVAIREMIVFFEQALETRATRVLISDEGPFEKPASGSIH